MARRLAFARLTIACVCTLVALVTADHDDDAFVTVGSAVKLQHVSTKYRLHSHEVTCVALRTQLLRPAATLSPVALPNQLPRRVAALTLLRAAMARAPGSKASRATPTATTATASGS